MSELHWMCQTGSADLVDSIGFHGNGGHRLVNVLAARLTRCHPIGQVYVSDSSSAVLSADSLLQLPVQFVHDRSALPQRLWAKRALHKLRCQPGVHVAEPLDACKLQQVLSLGNRPADEFVVVVQPGIREVHIQIPGQELKCILRRAIVYDEVCLIEKEQDSKLKVNGTQAGLRIEVDRFLAPNAAGKHVEAGSQDVKRIA